MAAKGVALRFELAPQLAVVVDLAVEYELHRAVGGVHRLVSKRGEVDDRESGVAKAHAGAVIEKVAGIVGATVTDGADSALKGAVIETTGITDDAAHLVETS
jgi:hypothetical protein